MKVAYSALGISASNTSIQGYVIFDSTPDPHFTGGIQFNINAYGFFCDGNSYGVAPGGNVGSARVPFGPNPNTVMPGSGVWVMGQWAADTGVLFQAVDNTTFSQPIQNAEDYRHLPPRMELICEFQHTPTTPFRPVGWLKLVWNPQFLLAPGVPPAFFQQPGN